VSLAVHAGVLIVAMRSSARGVAAQGRIPVRPALATPRVEIAAAEPAPIEVEVLDGPQRGHAAAGPSVQDRPPGGVGGGAAIMQRNLEVVWRATEDPEERRDALFTLWDECGEGDGRVGEAGERARKMVIGWIRARLPARSPGAFTPDEIARRSAHRRSTQPFVPYE
jgi:hypothetical protein